MTTSTSLLIATVLLLLITQAFGLLRAMIGPTLQDRMLSVQLVGSTGVGLLLLFGFLLEMPASVDVALVLALLAAVSVAALTRRESMQETDDD